MIDHVIEELKSFSTSIEYITRDAGMRALELVVEKIEDIINSSIIDVLRREPNRFGSTIMLPFVSQASRSRRGSLGGMQITMDSQGVWPWVYDSRKILWLDNILNMDMSKDANNLYDGSSVGEKFLSFARETDQILVIPLIFKDSVMGIFSIEFPNNMVVKRDMVNKLIDLADPIATVLWKTEVQDQFNEDTNESIKRFRSCIFGEPIGASLDSYRSGFLARPFSRDFGVVERFVNDTFQERDILMGSYQCRPGTSVVVEDIRSQIEASHFCVADITGYNNNVLLEVGLMYAYRKKTMLLISDDEPGEPPFDIRPFQLYRYVLQNEKLKVTVPSGNQLREFDEIVKEFYEDLMTMPSFVNAKPITR